MPTRFLFYVFSCLLLLPSLIQAQSKEFPVVIGESAYANMPGLAERIVDELVSQGLNAKLNVVPGERALYSLKNGHAALDIIRHKSVVEPYSQLMIVEPPVITVQMSRIVSASLKENCDKFGDDLSVVGIRGIRAFESVIVPRFKSISWAANEEHAFTMIAAGRADVTYWMKNRLNKLHAEYKDSLHVCNSNEVEMSLHSFIHKDFKWAKKQIESAYANLFSNSASNKIAQLEPK